MIEKIVLLGAVAVIAFYCIAKIMGHSLDGGELVRAAIHNKYPKRFVASMILLMAAVVFEIVVIIIFIATR